MFGHQVVIAIQNDNLQLTQHGLMVAILKIPREIRNTFDDPKYKPAYSWAGEAKDENGRRWCLLKIQYMDV